MANKKLLSVGFQSGIKNSQLLSKVYQSAVLSLCQNHSAKSPFHLMAILANTSAFSTQALGKIHISKKVILYVLKIHSFLFKQVW